MGARAFARRWAKRTVDGGHFTDLPLQGLGEEAWRIQEDFAGGQEVTYGWRRRLLLQIHIQCIFETCPSDILRAGRVWADAIDKEAVDAMPAMGWASLRKCPGGAVTPRGAAQEV
jgi:hypothetical protein